MAYVSHVPDQAPSMSQGKLPQVATPAIDQFLQPSTDLPTATHPPCAQSGAWRFRIASAASAAAPCRPERINAHRNALRARARVQTCVQGSTVPRNSYDASCCRTACRSVSHSNSVPGEQSDQAGSNPIFSSHHRPGLFRGDLHGDRLVGRSTAARFAACRLERPNGRIDANGRRGADRRPTRFPRPPSMSGPRCRTRLCSSPSNCFGLPERALRLERSHAARLAACARR